MRIVVLATDPADGNARAWRRQLSAAGAEARLLLGAPRRLPPADHVVAHVLLTGGAPHPVWRAALRYEAAGIPLLNSTRCLACCADKRRTHDAWAAAGLPQPRTWPLEELADWPAGRLLVKPAFGESSRGVTVVRDREHARRASRPWASQALVQEVVACRSVLRVHATAHAVIGAFARPASAIAGLPEPDPVERPVAVTDRLRELAIAAVRAVGGGLVGLDLVQTGADAYVLLEANPTFAMPTHLPLHLGRVVRAALDAAAR